MKYFCTYFDRNYLIKGLALIESLKHCSTSPVTVFIVCMDEITRIILNKLQLPNIKLIPLHKIEEGEYRLLGTKANRSTVEYLWTTTPAIILKVMDLYPEIDLLTYVDADLYFYSSYDCIYQEMSGSSVLIHEHRFPEKFKYQEKYGKYNVGLLCFKNDQYGMAVLKKWKEDCIQWCFNFVEDNKFGDQGYLNEWPELFSCVKVTQNLGIGVAPWNDDQYKFTLERGIPHVDGQPIVFYHYHSFAIINPFLYIPTKEEVYTPSREIFLYCVVPYINSLHCNITKVQSVIQDFKFGIFTHDFQLNSAHGFLAHHMLSEDLSKLNISQKREKINECWDLYI